ncbi:MAG: hypothetical protein LBN10_07635 [Propionibacteriaceae bacterium]|nr:hypothetical protein [Propionibacteriaceae bacterium]
MTRTRKSARTAGTRFETLVATYLAETLDDDRIERRSRNGVKDRGDITGVRHMGGRVVIECKNTTALDLSGWARQADIERGNDDAVVGVICHKRHGNALPENQWVTMTLAEFVALMTGNRDHTTNQPERNNRL